MRVVVIDDTHHVRAAIKSALEANGYRVVTVENGSLGLRAFGQSAFNVAIVDSRRWTASRSSKNCAAA